MSNETDSLSSGDGLKKPTVRAIRKDGWTEERRTQFLAMLARTGSISQSARAVGMSRMAVYRLRLRDPQFDDECAEQIHVSVDLLRDACFERVGTLFEQPVYDADGNITGYKREYSDTMLRFLLSRYDFNAERDFGGGRKGALARREARRDAPKQPTPKSYTQAFGYAGPRPRRASPEHATLQKLRSEQLTAKANVTMEWLDDAMFTEIADELFQPMAPRGKGYRPL